VSVSEEQLRSARLPKRVGLDGSGMTREIARAIGLVHELRRNDASIGRWVTFPLVNQTGDHADHDVEQYEAEPQNTQHYSELPRIATIVEELRADGFDIDYARVAVITGRGMLRPHVDNFPSLRLILPLTEQGTDFRHLFYDRCVAMRAGELWSVRPQTCHAAANIVDRGERVALLVDARLDSTVLPDWYPDEPGIPPDRLLRRTQWDETSRREVEGRSRRILDLVATSNEGIPVLPAEEEWLFAPFEFELAGDAAYSELTAFLGRVADESPTSASRLFWTSRAEHWAENNCVGAPASV
jgi:hypothetical protein